jgi:hypothetical protein
VGSKAAANGVTNWLGTSSITPLVAAFLADAFLGRYWTIALFLLISVVVRPPSRYTKRTRSTALELTFLVSPSLARFPPRAGLRGAHGERGGGAGERGVLRGAVPAGAGRRAAAGAHIVRGGPVRRGRRGGARPAELLLQLVLPVHQRGLADRRHRAGVGAVQRQLGARVRHPGAAQRGHRRGVPRRHRRVPAPPASGRQPAHQGRAGGRRRGQEVPRGGAGGRVGAARVRGRRRHVGDTGEPPARAHRPVQVSRCCTSTS